MKRLMFIFAFVFALAFVSAQEPGLCATATLTDIEPSSVEVDEEFTVGIAIENCGNTIPQFVTFEIVRLSEDLIVKEPLTLEIGSLQYSNSKRFITYHMRTSPDATPGTYEIHTKLSYGSASGYFIKEQSFNVTVTSDEAEIALASAKTNPVFPSTGEPMALTLRIENFGNGDANSVKADLIGLDDFTGAKKSFLGELAANDDGILTFNLIPQKAGTYSYELVVTFSDDFGTHEYRESLEVVVQKKQSNFVVILIVLVVLGAIGWFFFRRHKRKKKDFHMIHKLSKRGG